MNKAESSSDDEDALPSGDDNELQSGDCKC